MNGCDSCGGAHPGSTFDMRQRFEAMVQVPGDEGGGYPARLPGYMIIHMAGLEPAALEQRTQQRQCLRSRPRSSGGATALAYSTA